MTRIAITGGPRTGKTTLASRLCIDVAVEAGIANPKHRGLGEREIVHHTDDLIDLGWSEASQAAAALLDAPGPWIVEGVAVSRALRKWREQHPGQPPPVDRVIYLTEPHEPLTPGQRSMSKGVETVHREIEPWLDEHGITTERR